MEVSKNIRRMPIVHPANADSGAARTSGECRYRSLCTTLQVWAAIPSHSRRVCGSKAVRQCPHGEVREAKIVAFDAGDGRLVGSGHEAVRLVHFVELRK